MTNEHADMNSLERQQFVRRIQDPPTGSLRQRYADHWQGRDPRRVAETAALFDKSTGWLLALVFSFGCGYLVGVGINLMRGVGL